MVRKLHVDVYYVFKAFTILSVVVEELPKSAHNGTKNEFVKLHDESKKNFSMQWEIQQIQISGGMNS